MATTRDYYEILGVPRDADERAIKSAFRKLARELHPDVSDHPEAHERFREAAEAYEVLSKSETRELYDRYGHEGLRTGGFRPTDFDFGNLGDLFSAFFGDDLFGGLGGRTTRRSARGADILAEVEIELAEAAEGAKRSVEFPAVVDCSTSGWDRRLVVSFIRVYSLQGGLTTGRQVRDSPRRPLHWSDPPPMLTSVRLSSQPGPVSRPGVGAG